MSYEGPNFTQTPNLFFDEHLPEMNLAECKVVLAVIRETFGWHRSKEELSIQELQRLTGLSNRGVIDGTRAAIQKGILSREETEESYKYWLNVEESGSEQSSQGGVSNPHRGSEKSSQGGGEKSSHHSNKRRKKESKEKTTAASAPAHAQQTDDPFAVEVNDLDAITTAAFGRTLGAVGTKSQIRQLCEDGGQEAWDALRAVCELIKRKGWNATAPMVKKKLVNQLNLLYEADEQQRQQQRTDEPQSFKEKARRIFQAAGKGTGLQ